MTRARLGLAAAMIPFAVAASLAGGCAASSSAGGGAVPTDGAGLVASVCTRCHQAQRFESVKKDRSGWTTTVTRMQTHGLSVTDAQKQTIIDYLTKRDGGS